MKAGATYRDTQNRILRAEDALGAGNVSEAHRLFREAATIQSGLVDLLPPDRVRTKSVYGASAAALYYKADAIREAQNLALKLLNEPWLEEYSAGQLRELLQQIWEDQSLAHKRTASHNIAVGRDVLSVRLVRGDDRSRLRLRTAPDVFSSVYRMFAFGASVEHRPRAYYERPTRLGLMFAHELDITPAEVRSYSFTVESGLDDAAIAASAFNENMAEARAFRRRVMARVVRGLLRHSATPPSHPPTSPFEEYEIGLNSNMAAALVTLYQQLSDVSAEIEFSIGWAGTHPAPDDLKEVDKIRYDERAVAIVDGLSKAMKVEPSAAELVNVTGKITGLKDSTDEQLDLWERINRSEGDDDSAEFDRDRVVSLKNIGVHGPPHIHFSLGESHYKIACDAHKDRRTVFAKGWMKKKMGKWILDPCDEFGIVGA